MADEKKNEEVILNAPKALEEETFKKLIISNLEQNYPEELEKLYSSLTKEDLESITDQKMTLKEGKEYVAYLQQISYIQDTCIQYALNENTRDAYNTLNEVCFFDDNDLNYMRTIEGENLEQTLSSYIEERLENIPDLTLALSITRDYNEALLYITTDMDNLSTYTAIQMADKISSYNRELGKEEKAKSCFILSKLYRKLAAKTTPYATDIKPTESEKNYLQKVLSLSSDYNLIACCHERLQEKEYRKLLIGAYSNALKKKNNNQSKRHILPISDMSLLTPQEQRRKEQYNINLALAKLYSQKINDIGFSFSNSEKVKSGKESIRYFMQAYKFSKKEDKKTLLENMASIQMTIGDNDGWENTKNVIAKKFLNGEERCLAYIDIGNKVGKADYYLKAINGCQKMKVPALTKLNIMSKAYEQIINNSHDQETIKNAYKELQKLKIETKNKMNTMLGSNSKN